MSADILGLTAPIMALVFAALFFGLWWRGQLGKPVLAFAAGYVMFAAGFIVTHVLPSGAAYVYFVTHAFYTGASILLVWGTCTRAGRPSYIGLHLGMFAISCAVLMIAVMLSNDAGPRLIIVNAAYAMMFLVAFVSLLGAERRSFMDTAILWVLAIHTVDFMIRPMITSLAEGVIPAEEYRQSTYYAVISMVLMVKTLNTAIVLVGASIFDLMQAVRERADRDALTGIRNRSAFEADIAQPIAMAERIDEPMSLIVADIDHFKQVNDLWGHQAGDEAIASFARLLERVVRDGDVCGRIGGEEFCVLVRDCPPEAALRLAERIRLEFAQTSHSSIGDSIALTASFGVAHLRAGESYHRLFARADEALYRAKQGGRNRVDYEQEQALSLAEESRAAAA